MVLRRVMRLVLLLATTWGVSALHAKKEATTSVEFSPEGSLTVVHPKPTHGLVHGDEAPLDGEGIPAGYTKYSQTCLAGANTKKFDDKSIDDCAAYCDADKNCMAFEYTGEHHENGTNSNTTKTDKEHNKTCVTESASDLTGCDGDDHGKDTYVKQAAPSDYLEFPKSSVSGAKIKSYRGNSFEECAAHCNDDLSCDAFECGMANGGDAQQNENLLVYVKEAVPSNYTKYARACIGGAAIKTLAGKTLEECAAECNKHKSCIAFEWGDGHDCKTESRTDMTACKQAHYHLDVYVKKAGLESSITTENDPNQPQYDTQPALGPGPGASPAGD